MKTYMPPKKPVMTFLYHNNCPEGKMFTNEELEEMVENGWVDSPVKLDIKKDDSLEVTEEQVSRMSPDQLVKMVESLGFKVFTPEMLKAEIAKFATVSLNLDDCNSESLIDVLVKRGAITVSSADKAQNEVSDDSDVILNKLKEVFSVNPKQLNKHELVRLGKEVYGIHLISSWKEETLISKIEKAIKG